MLACALGGVMSGGVAQRVADWLDGTGEAVHRGPPVLLTWQASVIPPLLLVVLLLLCAWLAWRHRAAAPRRGWRDGRATDYRGETRRTPPRTRRIAAHARAWPPSPTARPASSASPPP